MTAEGRPAPVTPLCALLRRAPCFLRTPDTTVPLPVRLPSWPLPTAAPLGQAQQSAHTPHKGKREGARGNKALIRVTAPARVGGHEEPVCRVHGCACLKSAVPWLDAHRRTWLRACSVWTPVQLHCSDLLQTQSISIVRDSACISSWPLVRSAVSARGLFPFLASLPSR
jgi:hypothetical protein